MLGGVLNQLQVPFCWIWYSYSLHTLAAKFISANLSLKPLFYPLNRYPSDLLFLPFLPISELSPIIFYLQDNNFNDAKKYPLFQLNHNKFQSKLSTALPRRLTIGNVRFFWVELTTALDRALS